MLKNRLWTGLFLLIVALSGALLFMRALSHQDVANLAEITEGTVRHKPDVYFSSYKNLFLPVSESPSLPEITPDADWRSEKIQNQKDYPEWAAYYSPRAHVDDVVLMDIDVDGVDESVVFTSCFGCNAPSRNVDIYKGKRLIFTAEGGAMSLMPLPDRPGFVLRTMMVPHDGFTYITFYQADNEEYYVEKEEDRFFE